MILGSSDFRFSVLGFVLGIRGFMVGVIVIVVFVFIFLEFRLRVIEGRVFKVIDFV